MSTKKLHISMEFLNGGDVGLRFPSLEHFDLPLLQV